MLKQRQIARLPGLRDDISSQPTPVSGVTLDLKPLQLQRVRLGLAGKTVSVAAADDFGSLKICDLPSTNILVLGANVNLNTTQAGFTSNNGSAIDCALGTAATASTDFSNANEDNLMEKVDGTGTTAGSVRGAGMSDGGLAAVKLAAGAKSVYLNIADPVTTATGTLTLGADSYVDLWLIDLGDHS